ncbi:queuosine biosynthesis protein QueC [Porphyromonas endodontalis]|nr:queuosine biosynthesis protein QueC [Porphyromonas endodontalis]
MLTTAHNGARDGLIVLSGGLDSTTLLYDYRDEIALAVTFDYGSKHNQREIPCAQHHCRQLGIEHLIIPLGFMGQYFRSDLLLSGGEIPLGHITKRICKPRWYPFAMASC